MRRGGHALEISELMSRSWCKARFGTAPHVSQSEPAPNARRVCEAWWILGPLGT